jgi:putative ABC transport system permease protein
MSIPLLQGRGIRSTDDPSVPRVILVNRAMADRFFSDEDPLGVEIEVDGVSSARIVGVVGDVRMAGLATEPRPTMYFAADQVTYNFMTVVVRTASSPRSVLPAIRSEISDMDPELPLHNVRTADELLSGNVRSDAFTARFLTGFALLALALAAVGTYGVMASAVDRRRRELGIRMALGARPQDVFGMILREGGRIVLFGVGVGLVAAVLLSGAVSAVLYNISPLDPGAYVVTATTLVVVGLSTVALSAQRAARTDPIEPLRAD